MRTVEQISNLRKVFIGMYGAIAFFFTDEDINTMADKIQEKAIKSTEWTWEIRIRTDDNLEKDWSEIKKEPRTPKCSYDLIYKKCEELISKYPNILSIFLVAKEDPDLTLEVSSSTISN